MRCLWVLESSALKTVNQRITAQYFKSWVSEDLNAEFHLVVPKWYHLPNPPGWEGALISHLFQHSPRQQVHYKHPSPREKQNQMQINKRGCWEPLGNARSWGTTSIIKNTLNYYQYSEFVSILLKYGLSKMKLHKWSNIIHVPAPPSPASALSATRLSSFWPARLIFTPLPHYYSRHTSLLGNSPPKWLL